MFYLFLAMSREKEDLTKSYDKNPYTNRKFENQWTTQKRHLKLRLRDDCGPMVSLSNNSHPTDVVKPAYRYPTFPLTAKAV